MTEFKVGDSVCGVRFEGVQKVEARYKGVLK